MKTELTTAIEILEKLYQSQEAFPWVDKYGDALNLLYAARGEISDFDPLQHVRDLRDASMLTWRGV